MTTTDDLWEYLKKGNEVTFSLSWTRVDGDFLDYAFCATEQKSITKKNRRLWR